MQESRAYQEREKRTVLWCGEEYDDYGDGRWKRKTKKECYRVICKTSEEMQCQ